MGKKTVLIIDDAYFMRNLLKKHLKEAGYEIIGEAKNGKEGIKLYFELKPDIVTMDIAMPDISGIEATKQILSKDAGAKIIAVTGNNDENIKREIIEAGVMDYLKKPFQPAFLWEKLDNMFINKKTPVSENSNTTIVEETEFEDSFDDMEIEILDKPDNSKDEPIVIENNEANIVFPQEDDDKQEQYSLTGEKTHLQINDEDEDEDFSFEQEIAPDNKSNHSQFKQTSIDIKPPRGKVLKNAHYEIDNDNEDIEEPELNYSEDYNYNNKNEPTGLLGKIKKLFSK